MSDLRLNLFEPVRLERDDGFARNACYSEACLHVFALGPSELSMKLECGKHARVFKSAHVIRGNHVGSWQCGVVFPKK